MLSPANPDVLVGAEVSYTCNTGYSLEVGRGGATVVGVAVYGFLTSVCDMSGEWHLVPTCVGELGSSGGHVI